MPKPHPGLMSGVTYQIPVYTDDADIERAFIEFADTLPPAPAAIKTITVTADVANPEMNSLYVFDGAGPNTLTLLPGGRDGDKIQILQLQPGAITVNANGLTFQGPTATTTEYSALTLIWQAVPGRWVGSPFSSSGILPPESQGGDSSIVSGGFRYHIFRNSGAFYAHKDMDVSVTLVGAGGDGTAATASPGLGGSPGEFRTLPVEHVESMTSYPVMVGKTPKDNGEPSSWRGTAVQGGVAGAAAGAAAVALPFPADVLALIGVSAVGGDGAADAGPVAPATYGRGGSGAYLIKATVGRPSHTVTHSSPGTPDRWIVTRPAWSETVLSHYETVVHHGDPCQGTWKDQCPGGWYCVQAGQPNNWCETQTQEPRYTTVHHPEEGYWGGGSPGSSWQETVWDPCPAGYTESGQSCVDARSTGYGQGGDGLVVVAYAFP